MMNELSGRSFLRALFHVGQRILRNPAWRDALLDEAHKAWSIEEEQVPSELAGAERSLAQVDERISNLVDSVENGLCVPELETRLAERRSERDAWAEKVDRLRRAQDNRKPPPTGAWVDQKLRRLGDVFSNGGPAAALALRDLVGDERAR